MTKHERYMSQALDLAEKSARQGTGPFGCVIVKNGVVVGKGWNQVTKLNDPTAHAEMQAIRKASKHLRTFQLGQCDVYTSCAPCPMCLSALYWARPRSIYYLNTTEQAARIGFDDRFVYDELKRPNHRRRYRMQRIQLPNAQRAFHAWSENEQRIVY